jgi:hypothetical protein
LYPTVESLTFLTRAFASCRWNKTRRWIETSSSAGGRRGGRIAENQGDALRGIDAGRHAVVAFHYRLVGEDGRLRDEHDDDATTAVKPAPA